MVDGFRRFSSWFRRRDPAARSDNDETVEVLGICGFIMPLACDFPHPVRRKAAEGADRNFSIARKGGPSFTFGRKDLTTIEDTRPCWGNVPGMLIAGNNRPQNATPGPGAYEALQTPPASARRTKSGFDNCVDMESFRTRAPRWRFTERTSGGKRIDGEDDGSRQRHNQPGPGHYPVYGDFPIGNAGKLGTILSTRFRNPKWSIAKTHTGAFRNCSLDKQALRTTQRPSAEHEKDHEFSDLFKRPKPNQPNAPKWSIGCRRDRRKADEGPGPGHYATYGDFSDDTYGGRPA